MLRPGRAPVPEGPIAICSRTRNAWTSWPTRSRPRAWISRSWFVDRRRPARRRSLANAAARGQPAPRDHSCDSAAREVAGSANRGDRRLIENPQHLRPSRFAGELTALKRIAAVSPGHGGRSSADHRPRHGRRVRRGARRTEMLAEGHLRGDDHFAAARWASRSPAAHRLPLARGSWSTTT